MAKHSKAQQMTAKPTIAEHGKGKHWIAKHSTEKHCAAQKKITNHTQNLEQQSKALPSEENV